MNVAPKSSKSGKKSKKDEGHPARKTFAENLKKHRLAQGISQEALAELADLHRTYVGSVERNERNISIDNMGKLADALKVTLAELLTD